MHALQCGYNCSWHQLSRLIPSRRLLQLPRNGSPWPRRILCHHPPPTLSPRRGPHEHYSLLRPPSSYPSTDRNQARYRSTGARCRHYCRAVWSRSGSGRGQCPTAASSARGASPRGRETSGGFYASDAPPSAPSREYGGEGGTRRSVVWGPRGAVDVSPLWPPHAPRWPSPSWGRRRASNAPPRGARTDASPTPAPRQIYATAATRARTRVEGRLRPGRAWRHFPRGFPAPTPLAPRPPPAAV